MRYYGPIWNELKNKKTVRITANSALHRRIKKAVGKEKTLDLNYKLSIEPKIAVMHVTAKNSILTFLLEERTPVTELWRLV